MTVREIQDSTGRRLVLRKFGVVEMLRLFKALGSDLSTNQSYLGMAIIAYSVAMIDDVPIPIPVNEASIEAILERLGDEGAAAVSSAIKPAPVEDVVAAAGN